MKENIKTSQAAFPDFSNRNDDLSQQDFQPQNQANDVMPNAPDSVMTVKNMSQEQPTQANPMSSTIQSFIKNNTQDAQPNQTLTVSFTVMPKESELKGIRLMEAVLKACESVGADLSNFSIRKDDKKQKSV